MYRPWLRLRGDAFAGAQPNGAAGSTLCPAFARSLEAGDEAGQPVRVQHGLDPLGSAARGMGAGQGVAGEVEGAQCMTDSAVPSHPGEITARVEFRIANAVLQATARATPAG